MAQNHISKTANITSATFDRKKSDNTIAAIDISANISKTVSCSVTCQLALNISSTGAL